MADQKISELAAADALGGTELVPVVQSGINKRSTPDAFRDRAIGSLGSLTAASALSGSEIVGVSQSSNPRRATVDEIAQLARVVVASTAPTSPDPGQLWLDTSTTPDTLKVWVPGTPGEWAAVAVLSVNGRQGAVTLTDSDVPATVVTESGTSRSMANADAGSYIRFTSGSAKSATFGTGLNVVGQEFHLRNVGANNLTLTASSTTLNAPTGGTLIVPPGGTVTVKQVASTTFDVFGTTTAA